MKKIVLALALCTVLIAGQLTSFAAEPTPVTAVDGNVTISAKVDAPDGTPVLIFILPAVIEDDEDVTVDKIESITSREDIRSINTEYIGLGYASNGKVDYSCIMKDSLPTGKCHVILSYMGGEVASAGSFEHVGQNDKNSLTSKFNDNSADTWISAIEDDILGELDTDGETRLEPKGVLYKSSADTEYYSSLSGEEKTEFITLLSELKGEGDFTLPTLVNCFNETAVWMKLRLEEDTLDVLTNYNGESTGKFWQLDIGEESDFAKLPREEKTVILASLKSGGYKDEAALEEDFRENVVLSLFRSAADREGLLSLIDEAGSYSTEFAGVRGIISTAQLDEYNKAVLLNAVLDGNKNCTSIEQIEALFTASVPQPSQNTGSGSAGSGGSVSMGGSLGSGGSGGKVSLGGGSPAVYKPEAEQPKKISFDDVAEGHWAYSYITRLAGDGVVNGVGGSRFAPLDAVTRQDFVKLLTGVLELKAVETDISFADVAKDSYYASAVMTAYKKGLVSGMSDSLFGTGYEIRREDAAVMMARALESFGIQRGDTAEEYADSSNISDYAVQSVKKVSAAGIFTGDGNGNFNPGESLSRAEACAILCRLADIVKGGYES